MIVSGDRDVYQLVGDGIRVMTTSRGVTDTKIYDAEGVVERYGVPPELVTDFIGLKGDTSDNIPGVPGIGDKTAAQLLQQFGDLEGVLGAVDEISGAKRKQNLTEHADDARVSKQLATMVTDVEVPIEITEPAAIVARPLEAARRGQRVRAAGRDPAPRRRVGRGRARAHGRGDDRGRGRGGLAGATSPRARSRLRSAAGAGPPATASGWSPATPATSRRSPPSCASRPLIGHDIKGLGGHGPRQPARRRPPRGARPRPRHDGRRLPDRSGAPHLRAARARRRRRASRRRRPGPRTASSASRRRRATSPATRPSTRGSPASSPSASARGWTSSGSSGC